MTIEREVFSSFFWLEPKVGLSIMKQPGKLLQQRAELRGGSIGSKASSAQDLHAPAVVSQQ